MKNLHHGIPVGCFLALLGALGTFSAAAQDKKPAETKPAVAAPAPTFDSALANLKFREIGPAIMGGRVDDFAVVENNTDTVYFGAASGGVWKTTNGGITWEPLFDHEAVSTIGAIAVAPSDPSLVWVGTGEANNRQSSSWGNGIYKSTDSGKTWKHMGLDATQHIGRIAIHPANPNIVYAAALGHLWGPNPERGLYKTTDGGKTWKQVLSINDDTGVVDVAMDPQSPDTLYAAAYERRRTPYGYNGGGPGGGIYKTTDGGATWKKLGAPPSAPSSAGGSAGAAAKGGLPEGDTGRIGLAIYRRNPNIVYALVENAKGGIFRSEDKGETWAKMGETDPRPSYYSRVVVDPNNDLRIWVLGAPMYYSEDGGKTFRTNWVQKIHGDFHALWIDAANSNHMWAGSDGGIHTSRDGGRTWDYLNTIPLGQFYELGYDLRQPYNICGGLQDNGAWCGPSRTLFTGGNTNESWFRVGGGDGFYVKIDPADPDTVYGESQDGSLFRRDLRISEARTIRPRPPEGEAPYRFNWNSPLEISSHDAKTIYYGGNFLFRSTDRGDSWTKLGGDLTTGVDRSTLSILGKTPEKETLSRNDGVEWYPTITTISESPLTSAVLWVGTDDGNLQVTRDAGAHWRNVAGRVPGVPKGTYVSRVLASRAAEGTAFAAFDGHRGNDFHVYLFLTTDYGETWKAISDGLPDDGGTVHAIREHPQDLNLLFAGTEYGAYWSSDRGAHWRRLKMNLPTVPIFDIEIQPREDDLLLGTHGRSIWILDDLSSLEQLDDKVLASDLHVFPVRPSIAWRLFSNKGNTGHKFFVVPDPPFGPPIDYYLKIKPEEKEKVKITISDAGGKVVRELDGEKNAGINRVHWDLRYTAPVEPTPEQREAQEQGFFGGPRGPRVDPGEYTVKVVAGKNEETQKITVLEDPRIAIRPEDRAARREMLDKLYEMDKTADQGRKTIKGLKASLEAARAGWKKPDAPKIPEAITKSAEELAKKIEALEGSFIAPEEAQGFAGAPLKYTPPPLTQRVGQLMAELDGYTAAPTAAQREELTALEPLLRQAIDKLHKLVDEDLANLNKALNEAGVPHITSAPPAAEKP
jgi:photosystem II stability/assembly factor-like uncharacterized protein